MALLILDAIWLVTCLAVFLMVMNGTSVTSSSGTWFAGGVIALVLIGCVLGGGRWATEPLVRRVAISAVAIGAVSAVVVLIWTADNGLDLRFDRIEPAATALAERALTEPGAWTEGDSCRTLPDDLHPVDSLVEVATVCNRGTRSDPRLYFEAADYSTLVYMPSAGDDPMVKYFNSICVRDLPGSWAALAPSTPACPWGYTFAPAP